MNKPSTIRRILTTDLPVLMIVLFAMGPFAWMVLTSLTPTETLNATGVSVSPAGWSLDNYVRLLRQTSFLGNMLDSLIIACGTVVLGLAVAVTAAYAFSRFRFAGRKVLMLQFLLINMFPIVLLILPLFVLMRKVGILDTHFGLILANATVALARIRAKCVSRMLNFRISTKSGRISSTTGNMLMTRNWTISSRRPAKRKREKA